MGRFKEEIAAADKRYGEAIVEVRAISDVRSWFLNKCGLETGGKFLRTPGADIIKEVGCLFKFLREFGTPPQELEIFYLGLTHAAKKY